MRHLPAQTRPLGEAFASGREANNNDNSDKFRTIDMRIITLGSHVSKLAGVIALCTGLAACGGGSSGTTLDNLNGGGGGGGGGSSSSAGNDLAEIGSGSGANFQPGAIGVGIGDGVLSAGGNTLLTVNVVNNGVLITDAVDVTFSSPCIAAGEALLSPQSGEICESDCPTNIVQTTNGQATIRYTANGCIGTDSISATTSYGGSVISANGAIEIAADTVQSLTFVEASPSAISLRGTGGNETSTLTFRVRGSTGAPVKGIDVDFTLNSSSGGLSLVNDSGTSDVDGLVYTTVQAGSVPGAVRVTATTEGGISTQSSQLVVSTGLPDQNSMSIAGSDNHPIAWRYNNVTSQITVNAADAFNNPVPDGTPIYFTTVGGAIGSSCLTGTSSDEDESVSGSCSVTWQSQSPKPEADQSFTIIEEPNNYGHTPYLQCNNGASHCRDGRVKILATTIGNESFIDANNNGMYDPDIDVFYTANSTEGNTAARAKNCKRSEPISGSASHADSGSTSQALGCDDLGSPYVDRNFDGRYNAGEEIATVNAGDNNSYEPGDGLYNGVLCREEDAAAGECTRDAVLVRAEHLLVMSCDAPLYTSDGRLPGEPTETVTFEPGETKSFKLMLADCNGNGIPGGTEISVNADLAKGVEAEVFPNGEISASSEYSYITLFISTDDSEAASGAVFVEFEVPTPGDGSIKYGSNGVRVFSEIPDAE